MEKEVEKEGEEEKTYSEKIRDSRNKNKFNTDEDVDYSITPRGIAFRRFVSYRRK